MNACTPPVHAWLRRRAHGLSRSRVADGACVVADITVTMFASSLASYDQGAVVCGAIVVAPLRRKTEQ
jgi:hypothetical protein